MPEESILVVFDNKENRRLLRKHLESAYRVLAPDPGSEDMEARLGEAFDLLLIDGACLDRYWERIRSRKEAEGEVLLPLLLATGSEEVRYLTRRLWQLVDEIVRTPIEKTELSLRAEILLRARRLSREAEERYFALAEAGLCGVAIVQRERILWANSALTRMLAISGQEARGLALGRIIRPEDREGVERFLREPGEERHSASFDVRLDPASGTCSARLQLARIGYRGHPAQLAMFTDLTEVLQTRDALRRANRAHQVLSRGNQALIRAEEEQALLDEVCGIIVHSGGYELAWVGYARPDRDKSVEVAARVGETRSLNGIHVSWADTEYGQGPAGRAIRHWEPAYSRDIREDPSFRPWRERAEKAAWLSCLALPLFFEEEILGALVIYSSVPEAFDTEETELLRELAEDLAHGIHALRVREERQQAREMLRESEHRFRSLFHNANDAIYIHDLSGGILEVNDVACSMTGHSRQELLEINVADLEAPEHAALLPERIAELRRAGSTIFETAHQGRDGSVIPVEVSSRLIDYGGTRAAQSLARDISRRKADEEKIHIMDMALRSSINSICLTDLEGTIFYANPAFASRTGYSDPGEVEGMPIRELSGDKDKSDQLLELIKERGSWRGETVARRKDGTSFEVELSANLVQNPRGEPVCLLGIYQDLTEIKQTRGDLERTLERLNQTVQGAIHTLSSALEQRDAYTAGHQERVTRLACAIAREMGLEENRVQGLYFAGMVHDLGKIAIPAEILAKPGRLSDPEFSLIKEHPRIGYDILKDIEFPWPIADMVLQHHERLDGSGYPQGLAGEGMLPESRILAVADVVEAMSSHRPYRPGLGIEAALEQIEKNTGVFYDTEVAEACLRLFREKDFSLG